MRTSPLHLAGWLLVFGIISILSHFHLPTIGMALCNADWGHAILESEKFRWGEWTAFYHGHDYGGTAMSYLRALWSASWDHRFIDPQAPWMGHMIFSFIIQPVLMAWSSYYLASCYCRPLGAWVAGLLAAIGFQFWITVYGNDFYLAGYLLWCLLLAWQSRMENPLLETTRLKLLGFAVVSGFSIYTMRASFLYVAAFFVPWDRSIADLRRLLRPASGFQKALFRLTVFFLGLYAYLSLFDRLIGQLPNGRKVFLDAEPNLHFGLASLALLHLIQSGRIYWLALKSPDLRARVALLLGGLVVGFSPELLAKKGNRDLIATSANLHQSEFREMLHKVLDLPLNLKEMVGGGYSLAQNLSILLFCWAIGHFLVKGHRDRKLNPVFMVSSLAIAAFCAVSTYTSGVTRYLFPLFPPLLIFVGKLVDDLGPKRRLASAFVAVLIAGFVYDHTLASRTFSREILRSGDLDRKIEVVSAFRQAGVEFVFTDSYSESNQYTVLSDENPVFAGPDGLTSRRNREKANSDLKHVGFFFSHAAQQFGQREVTWNGKIWKVRFMKHVGDRSLHEGWLQAAHL